MKSTSKKTKGIWTRIKREHGLYRYNPSGKYFARVRFRGKHYRQKLETADLDFAKRKLRTFKDDLARTDATKGNTSFGEVLKDYTKTFSGGGDSTLDKYFTALADKDGAALSEQGRKLTADSKTKQDKLAIVKKLKQTWTGVDTVALRTVKPSMVEAWLAEHYGHLSAAAYNAALSVIRGAFDLAVNDRIILESPVTGLTYRKRKKPIRPTPTFEQFKAIVADIRAQRFNADAEQSGDFVEFMGLAGLGQAEVSAVKRSDVHLDGGYFAAYRYKTDTGFAVPIFPQLRPLVEKLCTSKKSHERLFLIEQARKAVASACTRLGFLRQLDDGRLVPQFSQRSLRRMFVTRAIEKGIDIKTIAEWQGHRDGGKLILQTYSHVRAVHSQRMAQLMSDGEPANVVAFGAAS
jgi:integrase